ncbi:tetratricopeptide repeat protein [Baaleninema simplex]|uniref:tetratricopeptide repeat protein n=1 Tax=Baaleninema simplex TaxID=2862350 RepID=UPI00034C8B15|nr:glycosyltransferase family 41 protein [Baaleninema simplex]
MNDRLFDAWLSRVSDSETADLASGLKCAVASLAPSQVYCQVGVEDGKLFVAALSEAPEILAYAVDDFAEAEDAEAAFQQFADTMMEAGLEERVTFCAQDIADFFLELHQFDLDERIGVYVYNGSSDYRSVLMGLLFARSVLADSALLVVRSPQLSQFHDDSMPESNVRERTFKEARQAIADFLVSHPQARQFSEKLTSEAIAVLFWDANSSDIDLTGVDRFQQPEVIRLLKQLGNSLDSPLVDVMFNKAVQLYEQGDYEAADLAYQEVIERDPNRIEAWFNLGMLYYVSDRTDDAMALLQHCLKLDENRANVHYGLGLVWEKLEQTQRAIEAYERAIDLDLQFIEAYNNLGNIYYQNLDYVRAEAVYCQALQRQLSHFGLYLNLANALMMQNRLDEAIYFYRKAGEIDPNDERLKENLKRATLQKQLELPIIYETTAQIEVCRNRFKTSLENLVNRTILTDPETRQMILFGIGWHVNFYLAYQGKNDRKLQEKYGNFVYKVLDKNYPEWVKPKLMPPRSKNNKIRIGYVSYFMNLSSVSKLCLGWLKHANLKDFELYSYHLGRKEDFVSKRFAQYSYRFQQFDNAKVEDIARKILEDNLHILVFLDIGMYPKSTLLAAMRLAPVQCTTWCHPVTSGLPTVDYFLSCELMEPENAQEHYNETLILLPNIGVAYEKPNVSSPQKIRQDFQLNKDAIVYLSCQSLYKYLPRYDYIFAEIARQVPEAKFAFLSHEQDAVTELFRRRLDRAFSEVGLAADRFCKLLPRLDQVSYWNLNQISDVYLDTLTWSGGNTTLEAIACDLPIVTCPGEFMRGRHSYAILKMLGITETIATTEAEYIEIAVRLGRNTDWRREIVTKIQQYRDRVYEDTTCVDALEQFYREVFEARRIRREEETQLATD